MGTIATFDHTADVGLRITGSDLADLFRTAAEALFDYIVVNRSDIRVEEKETISLSADSTADLLVAWLNDLIFRCETRHRVYTQFDARLSAGGLHIDGTIGGEPIDRTRHVLDHEVKAVTHHAVTLKHENNAWVAEFILDI